MIGAGRSAFVRGGFRGLQGASQRSMQTAGRSFSSGAGSNKRSDASQVRTPEQTKPKSVRKFEAIVQDVRRDLMSRKIEREYGNVKVVAQAYGEKLSGISEGLELESEPTMGGDSGEGVLGAGREKKAEFGKVSVAYKSDAQQFGGFKAGFTLDLSVTSLVMKVLVGLDDTVMPSAVPKVDAGVVQGTAGMDVVQQQDVGKDLSVKAGWKHGFGTGKSIPLVAVAYKDARTGGGRELTLENLTVKHSPIAVSEDFLERVNDVIVRMDQAREDSAEMVWQQAISVMPGGDDDPMGDFIIEYAEAQARIIENNEYNAENAAKEKPGRASSRPISKAEIAAYGEKSGVKERE